MRLTERQNKVLPLPIGWFKSVLAVTQIIYADLLEANILPVADLFNYYRPDIAIADSNSICTLELTVFHKTNVVSSRDYKRDKYNDIADFRSTLAGNRKVYSHSIQISTLKFISNINDFTKCFPHASSV